MNIDEEDDDLTPTVSTVSLYSPSDMSMTISTNVQHYQIIIFNAARDGNLKRLKVF
jgi:hypothetical protein